MSNYSAVEEVQPFSCSQVLSPIIPEGENGCRGTSFKRINRFAWGTPAGSLMDSCRSHPPCLIPVLALNHVSKQASAIATFRHHRNSYTEACKREPQIFYIRIHLASHRKHWSARHLGSVVKFHLSVWLKTMASGTGQRLEPHQRIQGLHGLRDHLDLFASSFCFRAIMGELC